MPEHWVVLSAKDEGLYLLEWVAYHRVIGFDHVLIYTNDNTDSSLELFRRLDRFDWFHWQENQVAPDQSAQRVAYDAAFERLGPRDAWVYIADADEYLVLHQHDGVPALCAAHGDVDTIAVCWRLFGSAGQLRRRRGLVQERFTRAGPRDFHMHAQFKSLTRMGGPWRMLGLHQPIPQAGAAATCLVSTGDRVPAEPGFTPPVAPGQDRFALAQVNHYAVKSLAEFRMKRRRGHGNNPKNHAIFSDRYFVRFDQNAETDRSIARHLPAVKAEMARLTAEAELAPVLRALEQEYRARAPGLRHMRIGSMWNERRRQRRNPPEETGP